MVRKHFSRIPDLRADGDQAIQGNQETSASQAEKRETQVGSSKLKECTYYSRPPTTGLRDMCLSITGRSCRDIIVTLRIATCVQLAPKSRTVNRLTTMRYIKVGTVLLRAMTNRLRGVSDGD